MTLHRMPRSTPALSVLLQSLGDPAALELARALAVSERTARRWQRADQAPRAAMVALYFVSRWGWSEIESDALYAIDTARALSKALREENAALWAALSRLQGIGDFGCANDSLAACVAHLQAGPPLAWAGGNNPDQDAFQPRHAQLDTLKTALDGRDATDERQGCGDGVAAPPCSSADHSHQHRA